MFQQPILIDTQIQNCIDFFLWPAELLLRCPLSPGTPASKPAAAATQQRPCHALSSRHSALSPAPAAAGLSQGVYSEFDWFELVRV